VSSRVSVTLSAADLERQRANLERGALVAAGVAGLAVGAFCDVELTLPAGRRLTLPARVVLADGAGTVLALEPSGRGALADGLAPGGPPPAEDPQAPAALDGEPEEEPPAPAPANVQERLRGLSVVEQLRIAREGTQTERMVLERIYGKTVWEALLRNSHLTVPEVARLARMGTMPRPLLELVVANPAWLQAPQVRRALLANPRLSAEMVQKVLAALPREELKLVPQNTAYPVAVRMAAKALTRRG
jgi:hypothetical protein